VKGLDSGKKQKLGDKTLRVGIIYQFLVNELNDETAVSSTPYGTRRWHGISCPGLRCENEIGRS